MNTPETTYSEPPVPPRRRSRLPLVVLLVVGNLLVSMVGGMAGIILLSDTDAGWARAVRTFFKLDESEVAIPTRQTIRLEESSAIIDAAKKVSPAVVSISAEQQVVDFFGQVSTQEVAGGTGFILTSDGLIVTNKHVVSTQADYKVILSDGRILNGTVAARDPFNDLAIIKVDAKDLPTVELGSSDSLEIGQSIIAIGNALGEFKNSVTSGVVSAKGRNLDLTSDADRLTDLIQTDAAINPGNSGGPLVNLRGQVVGINTAIASSSGGSIGVGFAISIDSVKSVLDSVRKTGKIIRPYIGIRYQVVTRSVQQLYDLPVNYGAWVFAGTGSDAEAVIPGSPAAAAGIQNNDIILEVNGERIDADNSLTRRLQRYEVGQKVTLKVRRGEEEITLEVTLGELPQQ